MKNQAASRTEASMSHTEVRRLSLGMKDALESTHMGHPDFRVHDRGRGARTR
jgi:hypothetical protein